MFHADLSQLFPWMLAIFTVLGLIACCAWFYKCLKKCNDRCSLLQPNRDDPPYSMPSARGDQRNFYQVGTFRSALRPGGASMHMASTSMAMPLVGSMREPGYSFRGPFALKTTTTHYPPYSHLPPPPTYDEAMMSAPNPSPSLRIDLEHGQQQPSSSQHEHEPSTDIVQHEIIVVGQGADDPRDSSGMVEEADASNPGGHESGDTVQLTENTSSETEMSRSTNL